MKVVLFGASGSIGSGIREEFPAGNDVSLGLDDQQVSVSIEARELPRHFGAQVPHIGEQAGVLMVTALGDHLVERAAGHQAKQVVGRNGGHPSGATAVTDSSEASSLPADSSHASSSGDCR
jgi:hypothetical protein